MNLFSGRSLLIVMAVILLSAIIYGVAAANIVPESGAGDGSGTVSGYTITNIAWTLLASSPNQLSAVVFDVAPTAGASAASDVRITVDSGTTWITCTGPVVTTWTCSFGLGSEPSISGVTALQIVAVD